MPIDEIIAKNLNNIEQELAEAKSRNQETYYITSLETPVGTTDAEILSITRSLGEILVTKGYTTLVTGDVLFVKLQEDAPKIS